LVLTYLQRRKTDRKCTGLTISLLRSPTLTGELNEVQAMGADRHYQASHKARAAERRHVRISVKVRRPGETWVKSAIADLSVSGFRLQSFMKLLPGGELWIMLPGFEGRRARVLWTRGHEAGCAFEHPLHPAILDHVVKLHEAANRA
tara:strand:- start:2101 stop:2541 length:441 start_codon:yes stop_codon:yes gene_type:complete